jgi:hypothetical protein
MLVAGPAAARQTGGAAVAHRADAKAAVQQLLKRRNKVVRPPSTPSRDGDALVFIAMPVSQRVAALLTGSPVTGSSFQALMTSPSYGREGSPSSKQKGDVRYATINWGLEAHDGTKLAHAQAHGGLAQGNCLSDRSRRNRAGSGAGAGNDRCVASDGAACFASDGLADLDCLSGEYFAGDGAELSLSHCAR